MHERNDAWRNLLPGVVLIVLGGLFLAEKFSYLNFSWYFRTWWPLLLIAFGALQLVSRPHRPVGALVLITIGVIFQVDRLDLFYWWNMHQMWPLILIVIGLGLMICRFQRRPAETPPGSVGIKS
ncbi:MAG: DUF5668 domain-containing protein [Acidobacteria bacterium]|nr:DUF5668 domain-containing protein [Acidobacteriota bacterium]MCL5286476.1 DUF5668 domain-containing protein [Acidobacteriota bacterium]